MDSAAATSHEGAKASLRTLAAILPFSLRPTSAAGALLIPAAVHRLDAPVGGLVACAKTRSAARRLQALFSERRVRKSYVAVLAGTPPCESGVVRSPLEGKECVTFYRLLASQPSAQFGSLSTVELRPHTGRTHQLRRHCAEVLRCPIVGDTTYGGERVRASQALYLWAARLELGVAREDGEGGDGGEGGVEGGDSEVGEGESALGAEAGSDAAAAEGTAEEEEAAGDELGLAGRSFSAPPPEKFDKLLARDRRAWQCATARAGGVAGRELAARRES